MNYETLSQVRQALLHRADMMANHEDGELMRIAAALIIEFESMPEKLQTLAAELRRLESQLGNAQ